MLSSRHRAPLRALLPAAAGAACPWKADSLSRHAGGMAPALQTSCCLEEPRASPRETPMEELGLSPKGFYLLYLFQSWVGKSPGPVALPQISDQCSIISCTAPGWGFNECTKQIGEMRSKMSDEASCERVVRKLYHALRLQLCILAKTYLKH